MSRMLPPILASAARSWASRKPIRHDPKQVLHRERPRPPLVRLELGHGHSTSVSSPKPQVKRSELGKRVRSARERTVSVLRSI